MVPPLPQVGEVQAWLRIWGMSVGVGCESPSLSSAAAQVPTCRGHLGESRNPRNPGEEKLRAGEEEEKRDSEPQVCWFTLDRPTHLVPNRDLLHLFPSTHSAPILCTCIVNYSQKRLLTNYVHSEPSHSLPIPQPTAAEAWPSSSTLWFEQESSPLHTCESALPTPWVNKYF